MQIEVGPVAPVMSINYGKYGRLTTTGWIEKLWGVVWCEGVRLEMKKPPLLPNQSQE